MIDHLEVKLGPFNKEVGLPKSCCQVARRFSCGGADSVARVSSKAKRKLSSSSTGLDGYLRQRRETLLARKLSLASLSEAELRRVQAPRNRLLPKSVRDYIEQMARLANCAGIHICDGSDSERDWLLERMANEKMIKQLVGHQNCWLARTDPRDVARVESRTFICTRNKHDVVARNAQEEGALANWMHLDELEARLAKLLPGCMAGRTMYVVPFSMGPLGSPLSKVGLQLTDSAYVAASMRIMTRVSRAALQQMRAPTDYVRCFHSVGCPLPLKRQLVSNWPCDPDNTIVAHIPQRREIVSYGSGYGGNSLLAKKCFALRLGSAMGRDEGWLAEHMLIMGLTNAKGHKKYIAAAFPSACGKTNLAMMNPSLAGYKVECVGDDIAWMRFDETGQLRAINPEAGFFGVAPGTNEHSNPNAMRTIQSNTIFTNVAETEEGNFFWEGLEHTLKPGARVCDWQGNQWEAASGSGKKAAHPNSRFCAPAAQCPIIDPRWESPEGVPISAIIFGGRRPEGVPLVYEAFNWSHGVFVGASMRSESTAAAAEHKAKTIMHDPFAMRPFFGYNFGHYLEHWLSFGANPSLKLPKIFHVNWFGRDANSGDFLWPGFGENSRVLDWICRRVDGEECAETTPIGLIPTKEALNLQGLNKRPDLDQLFSISTKFWLNEQQLIEHYLKANLGSDLPEQILTQCQSLKQRLIKQQQEEEEEEAACFSQLN